MKRCSLFLERENLPDIFDILLLDKSRCFNKCGSARADKLNESFVFEIDFLYKI